MNNSLPQPFFLPPLPCTCSFCKFDPALVRFETCTEAVVQPHSLLHFHLGAPFHTRTLPTHQFGLVGFKPGEVVAVGSGSEGQCPPGLSFFSALPWVL